MSESRPCAGIKASGERCRGVAAAGSEFCAAHDPEREEERRRIAAAGGRASKRGPARSGPVSSELIRLARRLEQLGDDVLSGELETRRAAVAIQAIGGARGCLADSIRVRETEELETRLAELEAAAGAEEIAENYAWPAT